MTQPVKQASPTAYFALTPSFPAPAIVSNFPAQHTPSFFLRNSSPEISLPLTSSLTPLDRHLCPALSSACPPHCIPSLVHDGSPSPAARPSPTPTPLRNLNPLPFCLGIHYPPAILLPSGSMQPSQSCGERPRLMWKMRPGAAKAHEWFC